jgi:hypothetical protein
MICGLVFRETWQNKSEESTNSAGLSQTILEDKLAYETDVRAPVRFVGFLRLGMSLEARTLSLQSRNEGNTSRS